jgi:hypothetical protein
MYIKGKLSLVSVFIVCGIGLMVLGNPLLELIHSKTFLLPGTMIFVFLIISFLDANHGMACSYLLTKNEVPFMKATITAGFVTFVLLYLGLKYSSLGIWAMILAPGIAQAIYQNWKWPLLVKRELSIKMTDYWITLSEFVFKKK